MKIEQSEIPQHIGTKTLIIAIMLFAMISLQAKNINNCKQLFISEMVESNGQNRALELFNPSDSVIDLSDFSIRVFMNGQLTPLIIPLLGNLSPKSTFVIAHPAAGNDIKTKADILHPNMSFDGNDAIVLERIGGTQVDKIGEIGVDPGNSGWFVPPSGSTKDHDLRRKFPVDKGETDWNQGKNQWEVHPKDSVSNLKKHENVCKCSFSNATQGQWYVKGVQETWDFQQDIYVFRLANKQAYTGTLNMSVVDSMTFENATGLKFNVVHFNLASTDTDRQQVKNQIRNDTLFEFEFPGITKFPAADRTQEKWLFTSDVLNIVFHDPDPTQATVQYIANKYNLSVMHEPSPSLPKGSSSSWTYAYTINQTGCKTRHAVDVSNEIYEKDSATVKIAEPWMEPVGEIGTSVAGTNDQYFPDSWHITNTGQCLGANPAGNGIIDADCDIEEAWNLGFTGAGIKVAVLDKSIFNDNHPDISSKYINGYDYIDNDSDVTASSGPVNGQRPHGQACAGLIAGNANNNIGIAGVAYDAQIIPVISWFGSMYVGFQHACDTLVNADVISCSWGWDGYYSASLENDIGIARDSCRSGKGIPILFAAANDGNNTNTVFPAYLDNVIGIIASNPDDNKKTIGDGWNTSTSNYWGSNYGQLMDVAAPGTHYITTDLVGNDGYNPSFPNFLIFNNCTNSNLNNDYSYFSGTSGATPIAAGVCALILQANPNLTATEVQNILENTADKVGADTSGNPYDYNAVSPGRSYEMGYGRINAFSALLCAEDSNSNIIWFVTACDSYTVPSGDETYTSSGTYTDTITNAPGCDSIITINLTIVTVTNDTSVTKSGDSLISNANVGTYQWLNCDINYAVINGATNRTFKPTGTGNYAVAVTQNVCTDTSLCYNVIITGIRENMQAGTLAVYPNPARSMFTIELTDVKNVQYEIIDIIGKTIRKGILTSKLTTIDLSKNRSGLYFLVLKTENDIKTLKLTVIK